MSEDYRPEGSVLGGAIWMIVISTLLIWLPGVGGLIAGIVGGKKAGGVGSALLAWLMSSVLIGLLFLTFGTLITGFIPFGILAGVTGLILALIDSGSRLLGAIIGGLIA